MKKRFDNQNPIQVDNHRQARRDTIGREFSLFVSKLMKDPTQLLQKRFEPIIVSIGFVILAFSMADHSLLPYAQIFNYFALLSLILASRHRKSEKLMDLSLMIFMIFGGFHVILNIYDILRH